MSVRSFVRIIIDFCEEDMKGDETLLPTGSLNYGFWRFWKKLKKDLQKLALATVIWLFRDPDLDTVLTMFWVTFLKNIIFEISWYQGIESSRNQRIHRDVIWRVRVVGSEMFDSPLILQTSKKFTLRAPALQGVSSYCFEMLDQTSVHAFRIVLLIIAW